MKEHKTLRQRNTESLPKEKHAADVSPPHPPPLPLTEPKLSEMFHKQSVHIILQFGRVCEKDEIDSQFKRTAKGIFVKVVKPFIELNVVLAQLDFVISVFPILYSIYQFIF